MDGYSLFFLVVASLLTMSITHSILSSISERNVGMQRTYRRKEAADILGVTIDTLRNWELNRLFTNLCWKLTGALRQYDKNHKECMWEWETGSRGGSYRTAPWG